MFKHDTFNPLRILEAVQSFLTGLGERGEVAVTDLPAGDAPASDTPAPVVTDWKTTIPADIKADPIWEKFKEPADAFRSLVGAQKFLGREKLPVPVDENDKETYGMIFKRLGLPDKPEGYTLPTDLEIPDDLPLSDELITGFKAEAHKNGLLPQQVANLYKWFVGQQIAGHEGLKTQGKTVRDEAETKLRQEWGAAFTQNVALGEKVLTAFADEPTVNFLKTNGLHNNPDFIKFLAKVGKSMSEDQLVGKPRSLTLTPDEAQTQIDVIKQDKKHAYWDSTNPTHEAAVAEMERLTKLTMVGQQ